MGGAREAGDDAATRRLASELAETAAGVTPAGVELRSLAATTEANSRLVATRSAGRSPGGSPKLAVGVVVGRYVVLGVLGAGAMGVVYAAFDPELDRKVALKLLQVEAHGAGSGSEARTRLLREAQALARLSHPGVVAIHDVGVRGDEVWIAMELVEGRTLRAWLNERPRSLGEVLGVMQAAGRGLAAAHAVGLVHRDIKPDNVMVDGEGRVRVMDFGLARRGAGEDAVALVTSGERAMLAVDVTTAGSLIGTPAYMAPEQFRGESVGPAADMFGFCVTLWEALYAARPFAGRTLAELRDNVLAGRVVVTTGRGVPRWLTDVLRRGLAGEPARRWAGMAALLDALERGQARMGRRRWWLAGGVVAALAGGIAGGLAVQRRQAIAACEAEAGALGEWTRMRGDIERALLATGKQHAATVWEKTWPWLDRWANAWQAAHTSACLRREVEGEWDDDTYARAGDCLAGEQGRFISLLRTLAVADATMLNRATPAAAGLALPDRCLDAAVLREQPAHSDELQATARALTEQLAQAAALKATGGFAAGREVVQKVIAGAEVAGLSATLAEAELLAGVLASDLGDHAAAERSLMRALTAARAARDQRAAMLAVVQLIWVVGERQTRFAEGKVWAEAARLELVFVAGDTRDARANLANNLGQLLARQGQFTAAIAELEQALALWTELHGEGHPRVALALNNLGNATADGGDLVGGIARHEQALAIREQALGGEHPAVASSLSNLGMYLLRAGRAKEALAAQERALAIRERVFAAGHPDVLESFNNLANAYKGMARPDTALALYQRALASLQGLPAEGEAVLRATLHYNAATLYTARGEFAAAVAGHEQAMALFKQALGERSVKYTYPLIGLADVRAAQGQLDEAARLKEQALAIRVEVLGEEHLEVASCMAELAALARSRGQLDEALRRDSEALAIEEAKLGKDNVQLAQMLTGLGETQLAAGRPGEAIAPLERGLALTEPHTNLWRPTGWLRLLLARALWDSRGDRARARGLATLAEEGLGAGGDEKKRDEARAWLAAHPITGTGSGRR